MKTRGSYAVLATCLSLIFCTQLQAQKMVHWVGGTPGHEFDWNCSKNWSPQNVPDEFSDVFIENTSTKTFAYPTIQSEEVSINSLYLDAGAWLTISDNSSLKVYNYVTSVNGSHFKGGGTLKILNQHLNPGNNILKDVAISHE